MTFADWTWVDWSIAVIMVMSVIGGLSQGFFRSVCSLGGLLVGLSIAAWNYGHIAAVILPLVRIRSIADAIGFILIALLVMAIFAIVGAFLAKAFSMIGLGWLDGIAGALFGFVQGVFLVTLGILVIVAFFPESHWLTEARLPRMFFAACHLSTHASPAELAERVRHGLKILEEESPKWMHPNHG
jgi:membrane protein required for colicin V production